MFEKGGGMRFLGKVVIVTGGASGIGAAAVERFAKEGAQVIIADINAEHGSGMAAAINTNQSAGRVFFQQVDVSDWPQVEQFIRDAADRYGRIDILVNNTGIGTFSTTPDLPVDAWNRTIAVTLNSVFYCCKAAIPIMRASGGGIIVNTASVSGLAGDYGLAAYNAAKGGVVNYTRASAIDHIREGIRINCVCPGIVDTPAIAQLKNGMPDAWSRIVGSHPIGRASRAEEIASVILFLASDESSALVGSAVVADGGLHAWTGNPSLTLPIANQAQARN
jgi:meso-butanediol dehydrogenase / (S,S)-butanediol dehydrogenase / diacetyl reductase